MNYEYWSEIAQALAEIDQQKALVISKKPTSETIKFLRTHITSTLEQLKDSLEQILKEIYVHYILFALVALLDEEIQCQLSSQELIQWIPIQRDFYDTANAGELFYKTLDEILDDSNTPTIVYEVFYFTLKRGFRGKHAKAASRITRYLTFLSEKIHIESSKPPQPSSSEYSTKEKRTHSGRWYLTTFASILVVYGLFYLISTKY